ncbi:MAG: hypothetical protein LBJ12_08480 [Oscillospiraceae bacterium]|nr:hypothetical protein [Oscillospiraceae bacterium]
MEFNENCRNKIQGDFYRKDGQKPPSTSGINSLVSTPVFRKDWDYPTINGFHRNTQATSAVVVVFGVGFGFLSI